SSIFVLGKVSGYVTVGFFSMAKELAGLPVSRISAVVNQLACPVMAELQTSREGLRTSLLRALRLVLSASLPLCTGLILEADDFVRVILSEKWTPSVPILRILCVSSMIASFTVLLPPLLMARYRAAFLVRYTLLPLFVLPLPFLSGAAWSARLSESAAG